MSSEEQRWIRVAGPNRCQMCGDSVPAAWCFYINQTTWTHCWCETCVSELLKEEST